MKRTEPMESRTVSIDEKGWVTAPAEFLAIPSRCIQCAEHTSAAYEWQHGRLSIGIPACRRCVTGNERTALALFAVFCLLCLTFFFAIKGLGYQPAEVIPPAFILLGLVPLIVIAVITVACLGIPTSVPAFGVRIKMLDAKTRTVKIRFTRPDIQKEFVAATMFPDDQQDWPLDGSTESKA